MKLTVLVDNNTYIDQYLLGEPALCFHLQDENCSLLLDTGYSDVAIQNAQTLGIDLSSLTHIAISHGHNDHTRGLQYLHAQGLARNATVLAHPHTFLPRVEAGLSIGSPLSEADIRAHHHALLLSKDPVQVNDRLFFLGEIPRRHDFEAQRPMGSIGLSGQQQDDFVMDDTALAWRGVDGLFIITGCSHSGIANIIAHAQEVCGETRIRGVIGGFHLFEPCTQLSKTIDYFEQLKITEIYPCHCVSFAAKAAIHARMPVREVGVGLSLEL